MRKCILMVAIVGCCMSNNFAMEGSSRQRSKRESVAEKFKRDFPQFSILDSAEQLRSLNKRIKDTENKIIDSYFEIKYLISLYVIIKGGLKVTLDSHGKLSIVGAEEFYDPLKEEQFFSSPEQLSSFTHSVLQAKQLLAPEDY